MKRISNKKTDVERAFYGSKSIKFSNITIDGPADGESAFKESSKISVNKSTFNLRYPFWHNNKLEVKNSKMSSTCRAAFWYDKNLSIINVQSKGVKAIRECMNIYMEDCKFCSEEIFWNCNNITVNNSAIEGMYAFFGSEKIRINNITFKGKYSFQYVENAIIENCNLNTKDAFWHSRNVVCKNCKINGEYLGWYSEGLTLINCKISGTQPLCYCDKLKLVNCTFTKADLAFEYSEVKGNIIGNIISIKNPLKGKLRVSGTTEYIKDKNDRSHHKFKLKH